MFLLILFDALSVFFSFYLAMLSRFGVKPIPTYWFTFGFLLLITFLIFLYQNLYDRKRYVNQTKIFLKVILSCIYVVLLYILITFFTKFKFLELSRIVILLFFGYFLVLSLFFRVFIIPRIFVRWFRNKKRRKRVEIFAGNDHKEELIRMFHSHPVLGFRNCDREKEECTGTAFLWCEDFDLGNVYNSIREKMKDYSLVEAVIPAFQNLRMEPTWTRIGEMPVWEFYKGNHSKFSDFVIRLFDIISSLLVLIILGIPMLIFALIIRLESGSPVLFKQKRVGKDGRIFTFLKFRSMKNDIKDGTHKKYMKALINGERKDGEIFKMEDDSRITRFGRFIRKTSIDELPQFLNVLKGEMSVVGPRPPIPYEVDMYEKWHKERLKMKPGITGTWQVFGRSTLPFDESIFLDLYYKENRSVLFNLYLCLKTIPRVLLTVGAE